MLPLKQMFANEMMPGKFFESYNGIYSLYDYK